MGIDVYLEWDGMRQRPETNDWDSPEMKAYYEWKDNEPGIYLRESYHGQPYATEFLFREAWTKGDTTSRMDAFVGSMFGTMRKAGVKQIVGPTDAPPMAVPPTTRDNRVKEVRTEEERYHVFPSELLRERLEVAMEISRIRAKRLYKSSKKEADEAAGYVRQFVERHEQLEREGKHPRVIVSY